MSIVKKLIDEVVDGKDPSTLLEYSDPDSDFKFVSNNGEEGYGASAWRAIVDALGVAKANALPDLEDNQYNSFDGDGTYYQVQEVETKDGDIIGKLYK